MMVHIEDAPVAYAAMVSSLWLPDVTHFAVSPPLRLIAHVKSPTGWYHSRIRHDALIKCQHEIAEKDVIQKKHSHSNRGFGTPEFGAPYKKNVCAMDAENDQQHNNDEAQSIYPLSVELSSPVHAALLPSEKEYGLTPT